jgi:flagellar hook-associated protein 3 FlgL
MVNRVATFAFTNTMISENMRLQTKYSEVNTQISSGLISQDYKGIARDSQYLLAVESSQDKLSAYNSNGNTALSNINIMYSSIGRIEELVNSMISNIVASLGGDLVPANVLVSQADNALQETAGLLNTKVAGRYLFSGSDIDTQPVDLTDPLWVPQTPPSVINTTYYQGNNVINGVQISETLTVNYGVTADNTGFEKMLRAYNLVFNNPASTAARSEALDLLNQSIDDIANIRGVLSTQAKTVEEQMDKNEQDRVYLQELSTTIKEVDIPSASVRLTEIQGQLEAAYSASVRILNLSLVNYL